MSANPPTHPDKDDDRIRQMLRPLLEIAPPSEQYEARLRDRLREEQQRLYGAAAADTPAIAGAVGGEAGELAEQGADDLHHVPRRPRWVGWAAAAAALLIAVLLTQRDGEVTWASMVSALEQAEWVEAFTVTDHQPRQQGWFSNLRRVLAVKSAGGAELIDHRAGTRYHRPRGQDVIVGARVEGRTPLTTGDRLVLLLCRLAAIGDAAASSAAVQYTVQDQRVVRTAQGDTELHVRLDVHAPPRTLNVGFVIDPQTQRPQSATVKGGVAVSSKVAFRFPADGPETIYALGVPKTLPIVARAPDRVARLDRPSPPIVEETPQAPAARLQPIPRSTDQPTEAQPQPFAPVPQATPEPDTTPDPDTTPKRTPAGHKALATASVTPLGEPLPPAVPADEMRVTVDALMRKHWRSVGVTPVRKTTDQEFVRRIYLDLAGRIPTVHEVNTFLDNADPQRRSALIEDLLGQYDHASHLAAVWRGILIPDTEDETVAAELGSFERWLAERFRRNQPYDQLVRELLLAEGRVQQGGPLLFFSAQKLAPAEIARQTSRAFLGVRMDCAQCHDDFFDDRWEQEDFWSFAAFFSRMSNPEGMVQRVSPVMRVRDVPRGDVMIPETDQITPPRFPMTDVAVEESEQASRRRMLVDWLTSPDNPHFARATVNRVWSLLFGRGIVDPVDDMRAANPPVSAELLDTLAEDFKRSRFDLRRLLLVLTGAEAYQLSSTAPHDDPALRMNFAQMNVKCLSAEQLYDCIVVATKVDQASGASPASASLNRLNNTSRQQFLEHFQSPGGSATEYQAGIAQALTLMNGRLTTRATSAPSSGLLASLDAPFFTDTQRVDTLFLATVSRYPTDAERKAVLAFLSEAQGDAERSQALGDALWALLNSAEFTLIP